MPHSLYRPDLQENIATVLDELGRASAKAQQLTAPITSASKLQSQKHQLYLMKDGAANGGRGAVVGFLKVGYKKLFLLDRQRAHIEAEPLCILDFYIADNRQRHGYGLQLFDHMLQDKNVQPALMAYDRPSPKLLSFLAKHYNLTQSIPQVNNFVVFEGFFFDKSAGQLRKTPLRKADGEIKPYSLMEREVVRQEQRVPPWPFGPPQSPQRWVSSPYSQSPSGSPSRAPRAGPPQSPLLEHCRSRRTSCSLQGLVAKSSLYSRHLDLSTVLDERTLPGRTVPALRTLWASLGATDGPPSEHSRITSLPPLPAPKTCSEGHSEEDRSPPHQRQDHVSNSDQRLDRESTKDQRPDCESAKDQRLERVRQGGGDWAWTVGQNMFSAQWVKHKQQSRSTRPW
uniref:Alpha-tubulin N-acetyltransferase 1 n=1 Tax=Knipowitschia caucasica TaxID=637954 RepID=A0AAV2K2J1_KNICA